MKSDLKNRLKEKRFNHNRISQDELAKKVSVSRQTINAIENGKFNPSVKLAIQLAEVFNCKVEEIFFLEEKI
jgi:putative transcriptional regulator